MKMDRAMAERAFSVCGEKADPRQPQETAKSVTRHCEERRPRKSLP